MQALLTAWRFASGIVLRARWQMKQFLVVILGALLATAAAAAGAQGLSSMAGRGRDEGRSQDQNSGWQGRGQDAGFRAQESGRGERQSGGQSWGGTEPHSQGYGFGQQPQAQPYSQPYSQLQSQVGRQEWRDQRQQWGRDDHRQGWNNGLPNDYGHQDGWRDDRRHDDWRDHRRQDWRDDHRHGWRDDHGRHWNSWRDHGWRNSWRHGWNGHRWHSPSRYYYPRGYSYRSWTIGYRLPSVYYAPTYYIDWRSYGLTSPPWGCYWVRIDRDVLLVEIATGEVVDILRGFFY
ncbi:MAG: RcnB family protein [Xanthomonadales bacterium]|nr:RcnB family protein [Xanthomonadales bacterium]MCE7930162.1 hypothetical protein [Xanthomonadales bacterium PRO6]